MALCNEFGVRICNDDCVVAMVAGTSSCYCAHCGAVCEGQFGGCPAVWASGRNGDNVEVEIRAMGPIPGATCQQVNGAGQAGRLDLVRHIDIAPRATTPATPSAVPVSATVARHDTPLSAPSGPPAPPLESLSDGEVLRLIAERLTRVEGTLRSVDRRLSSLESAMASGDIVDVSGEVRALRTALTRLIG